MMSNPLESYFLSREKVAAGGAFGRFAGGIAETATLRGMGNVAGHAVATAGIVAGAGAATKIYNAITKKRDFNNMMEANPDLEEFQLENPAQFNRHYNALRGMNPTFGSEPIVAGTYMRQMSMAPSTAGKVVVESLGGVPADRSMQDFTGMGKFVQSGIPRPPQEYAEQQEARAAEKHMLDMESMKQRMADAKNKPSKSGAWEPVGAAPGGTSPTY
jgi:hypothetical protein